jgi:drug/metabolite transporter (DMT)-like permease
MKGRRSLHIAGLTVGALIGFACNSLLCRAALRSGAVDPVAFTSLRLLAGAVMLGLLSRTSPLRAPDPVSALVLFAYALPFSLAYLRLSAGTGALLLFGAVQISIFGWGLFKGERPSVRVWVGAALALAGLLALLAPGLTAPPPAFAALMLGAGVAWGAYTLRGRSAVAPLSVNASNFALACGPAALALGSAAPLFSLHVTRAGAVLAVVSGAIASGLGYSLWYAALPHLRRTQAAVVQLAVPPLATLGGALVLNETLSVRLLACGAVILCGIALATLGRAR